MPSLLSDSIREALSVTNQLLGVPCTYERAYDNEITENVLVIVERNKPVTDEFKNLIGYRVEANMLKSQVPTRPNDGDKITDDTGNEYRVSHVTKDTSTKWYVDVREI